MIDNYLIPNMQKYLMIAGPVLLLAGIGILLSKQKEKIKVTDFLLFLPFILLLFSGDGKLTTSFAYNRNNSFQIGKNIQKEQGLKEKDGMENYTIEHELEIDDSIDFHEVDFPVIDESYVGLSEAITYNKDPNKLAGKTIRVRGFSLMKSPFIPNQYFGIGKYVISCCAADAGFVGFIVQANEDDQIRDNTWYEIEGVLDVGEDSYGQTIGIIRMINYKKISSKKEKQYVYPCYAYGDGSCSEVIKYHLD